MSGNRGKLTPEMIEKQWKPGQSGNPRGRPKRPSFEALVAQVLDEAVPGSDWTKREALARVFVDELMKRNGALIREFLAREWPAVQKHEHDIAQPVSVDSLRSAIDRVGTRKPNGSATRESDRTGANGSGGGAA